MTPTASPVTKLDLMAATYACLVKSRKARTEYFKRYCWARAQDLKSELRQPKRESHQMEMGV